MTLDFQQVREQVRQLGERALIRERQIKGLREKARGLLRDNAHQLEELRRKVQLTVRNHDPSLRCALPVSEPLDAHFPLPPLPERATLLAADGSQIAPDRHAEVEYCLINVGAIQAGYGSADTPATRIVSHLLYDEDLSTPTGTLTEARLALRRDLNERAILAELASQAAAPVITFTDGPMEIWGAKDGDSEEASEFQKSLAEYLQVLSLLQELKVTTAGYVDKPGANLVVRLLEVAQMAETDLPEIRRKHPLRGVTDMDLYQPLLDCGERSPVFAMQSLSAKAYSGGLALRFFYLNVGRPGHDWLARVELPAWVAANPELLNNLHAVLVHQCRIMGARPYPYLLHRAHETALVSLEEKEQVTQMITQELLRRGVEMVGKSHKQTAKDLAGRTRYHERG